MPDFGITSGLPGLPVAKDALFEQLKPIYTAINAVAKSVSVVGGLVQYNQDELSQQNQLVGLISQNQNRLFVKALEDLTFGMLITISLSGGKLCARKADATDATKPAHGCVATIEGISTGLFGEVTVISGHTYGITGSAVGQYYWLGAAGLVQPVPPAAVGNLVQGVGFGLGTAGFVLNISSQLVVV